MKTEVMQRLQTIDSGNIPSGYKKTKYGIRPIDWGRYKLKEILRRESVPVTIDPVQSYREIGIRSHGRGIFYKEQTSGHKLGNKSVFWVQPNCFIVNIVFAWELAVAKTSEHEVGYIASHRFPMYRPVSGKLDLDFITYFFKSQQGESILNIASPGGAGRNKTLGQKEFLESEVIIPRNIEEQEKIAGILSTWDKAIELKAKLIQQKEEQRTGLLQELLTGKTRLGQHRGDWQEVKLEQIGCFLKGKGISKSQVSEKGFGCVLYGEIYTRHHVYIRKFFSYIREQDAKLCTKILRNDILFAGSGETAEDIGKSVAYLGDEPAFAGGDIIILRPKIKVDSLFLSYVLNSSRVAKERAKLGQGNSVVHIYPSTLSELKVPLPDYEEQREIAEVLQLFDRGLELLQQELSALEQQRKGLTQLLLTGKVRVQV